MPKLFLKLPLYISLALILIVTASGCKKDAAESKSNTSNNVEPASVKLQLVTAQIQLAGVYGAIKEGYFDKQKLTTELLFSNVVDTPESLDVINRVVNGEADFGLTPADNLIDARQQGKDVVAVMTIYQRDPTAIISLTKKNITRPDDLKGKKILVFNRSTSMSLFLAAVGIDPSEVTIVTPPEGNVNSAITLFLSGEVDAMVATGTEASAQMKAIGLEHNILFFNDYGVQMYPNTIFTTGAMLEQHPDVVQRFVNAVLDGTKYALAQPDEIADWFVANYADQMRADQLESQNEAMLAIIPLIQSSATQPGMMSDDVWAYIYDGMANAGFIQKTGSVHQAYTNRFVDAYYQQ